MASSKRPLSPHLGIYKWQLHMAMSIFHRATGVLLGFGLLLFVYGAMAVASGPESFAFYKGLLRHEIGQLVLLGVSFSLIYHALNGIRHLYWDAGRGYALESVRVSGIVVSLLSIILTAVVWTYSYGYLVF